MLVNIENIYKYFNGEPILKNINLSIEDREVYGLVGKNGCGKSTMLKIINGEMDFDKDELGNGNIAFANNLKIGFMHQNSGLESGCTIKEEIQKSFDELNKILERMKEIEKQMAELTEHGKEYENLANEYAEKSAYFEARDGYNMKTKINMVLSGMGFSEYDRSQIVSSLSGGEKTRLALAKLLLEEPDLLILDEPTNHLDFKTLMWLEDYLKGFKHTVLMVSHDRYFLDKLCTRICEIENGRLTQYNGNYSKYILQKKSNVARQLKEYDDQQKEIAKLEDYIARNKVRASTAKMAQSRQKALDKIQRIEKPDITTQIPKLKIEYDIEPTKVVLNLEDCDLTVGKGMAQKRLVESINLELRRGQKIGIIGENGIGKSSLLKTILGINPHSKGKIEWGMNVKKSYFDQEGATLAPANTVISEMQYRFPGTSDGILRKVLAGVLITGEDVFKPISVLSGGERAKLCFAIMSMERGNLLILDEPTNHLDLVAKDALEQSLDDYTGTILLVSHDRYLLNHVPDRIFELTPEGGTLYEGKFDDYLKQKQQAEIQLQTENTEDKIKNLEKPAYKSKQQRREQAERRNRISALEKEIEQLEQQAKSLEQEIAGGNSDYEKLNENCIKLEEIKKIINEKTDEWLELSE